MHNTILSCCWKSNRPPKYMYIFSRILHTVCNQRQTGCKTVRNKYEYKKIHFSIFIYIFIYEKVFSPFSNADFWNNFQHLSWISLELVNFTVTYSSQFGDERPNDLVSALKHWHTVATDSQSTALSYSNILVLYLSFCIAFNHLNASISCHDGVHLWKKCIFFTQKTW